MATGVAIRSARYSTGTAVGTDAHVWPKLGWNHLQRSRAFRAAACMARVSCATWPEGCQRGRAESCEGSTRLNATSAERQSSEASSTPISLGTTMVHRCRKRKVFGGVTSVSKSASRRKSILILTKKMCTLTEDVPRWQGRPPTAGGVRVERWRGQVKALQMKRRASREARILSNRLTEQSE